MDVERWNLLHPDASAAQGATSTQCLDGRAGPGDRRDRLHASVRRPDPRLVPGRYRVLGTDGFGRSDYRAKLRPFFEVDRHYVAVAALRRSPTKASAAAVVAEAIGNTDRSGKAGSDQSLTA